MQPPRGVRGRADPPEDERRDLPAAPPTQIETYLSRLGSQLDALRAALNKDDVLRDLAKSPLMLSVMTLAYQGASVAPWQEKRSKHPRLGASRYSTLTSPACSHAEAKRRVALAPRSKPRAGCRGWRITCSDTASPYS
jgi:hypothetical protein